MPGGGVERGESFEEAAKREAKEEVSLDVKIIRYLFKMEYDAGIEFCYLAEALDASAINLGSDPELDTDEQVLVEAQWIAIDSVRDDLHVSQVLKALTEEELNKYNIVKFPSKFGDPHISY